VLADFTLQTDYIYRLKTERFRGVLLHVSIVLVTTALFSLPRFSQWWPYVLFIGLSHIPIDFVKVRLSKLFPKAGIRLFLLDQLAHLLVVVGAVMIADNLSWKQIAQLLSSPSPDERVVVYCFGYVVSISVGFIFARMVAQNLAHGGRPVSWSTASKYLGMGERGLATTFVLLSWPYLLPLAIVPRLVLERKQIRRDGSLLPLAAEVASGLLLAVTVGLMLRGM